MPPDIATGSHKIPNVCNATQNCQGWSKIADVLPKVVIDGKLSLDVGDKRFDIGDDHRLETHYIISPTETLFTLV